jgi:hypothetical protein
VHLNVRFTRQANSTAISGIKILHEIEFRMVMTGVGVGMWDVVHLCRMIGRTNGDS